MENYKTILAAVDGSKASEHALKRAIKQAKKEDAELIILHVLDLSYYNSIEYYNLSVESDLEIYSVKLLEDCRTQALEAGVKKVTAVVEHGAPKIEIPKLATGKYKADLIVAGATGLGALERFIIGSVSEHITRRAKCDVLIVRMPEEK